MGEYFSVIVKKARLKKIEWFFFRFFPSFFCRSFYSALLMFVLGVRMLFVACAIDGLLQLMSGISAATSDEEAFREFFDKLAYDVEEQVFLR